MDTIPHPGRPGRVPAAVLAMAGALAAALLAGCNGEDARTDCSLDACTITFDRGADGSAEVLGVTVELVSATEEEVTVAAGGQDVTVPVGETREVAGLTIEVDRVTQDEVVVRATR